MTKSSRLSWNPTKFFEFERNKTSYKKEFIGGMVTFLTMAYILVVNPLILGGTFGTKSGIFLATAIVAGVSTIVMGVVTNLPFALAAGMGVNSMIAAEVSQGTLSDPYYALSAVILESSIFIVISITPLRVWATRAVPATLKTAISIGIGAFIAYIGLKNMGILTFHNGPHFHLGKNVAPWLGLIGLIAAIVLQVMKVKGSFIIVILGISLIGWASKTGKASWPEFNHIVQQWEGLDKTFGKGFTHMGGAVKDPHVWFLVLIFLFGDFFSSNGTFIGALEGMGKNEKEVNIKNAYIVDACASLSSGIMGTNPATTYVESLSGITEGARTGFSSVVTGIMFLLSILISPIFTAIPGYATGGVLLFIGIFMFKGVGNLKNVQLETLIPTFITLIGTIFFGMVVGFGLAIISYLAVELAKGKWKQSPTIYVMSAIFIAYFIWLV